MGSEKAHLERTSKTNAAKLCPRLCAGDLFSQQEEVELGTVGRTSMPHQLHSPGWHPRAHKSRFDAYVRFTKKL
jgi:hypothetical protein